MESDEEQTKNKRKLEELPAPKKKGRLGLRHPSSSSFKSPISSFKVNAFKSPLIKSDTPQPQNVIEEEPWYFYNVVFAIAQKKKKNYIEGNHFLFIVITIINY